MSNFKKLSAALAIISLCSSAYSESGSSDTDALLTNFGAYVGYDLLQNFKDTPYSSLFDAASASLISQNAIMSFYGALTVNAFNSQLAQFLPQNDAYPSISALNNLSNETFSSNAYNSPNGGSGSITVNPYLDQESFQNDPTNQAIVNILTTPDYTFCMNNDSSAWLSSCNYLYNYNVTNNVIGTTPSLSRFFSYDYNQNVVPQLNSNTLLAPLLYDTSNNNNSGNSSDQTKSSQNSGLTASNQLQEAANFIRYATYGVTPINMPSYQEYSNKYTTATSTTASPKDVADAQHDINQFIIDTRSYASIASVPISNLYYMLSKRMPQTNGSASTPPSSQALNEFIMATRRLNPQSTQSNGTPSWITQINTASSATVQKEIALLLAEMNYQLYLNRQQEERVLLTNSLLLMIMAHQNLPQFSTSAPEGSK